ncbi:MAG TPA: hypothetical protein VEZ14_04480 [Dehalococcoidia bacterium]|nr:hypothetical protein [Dehalococcoidia bacterium]
MEPRKYAEQVERAPALPAGGDERFQGYGVMGEPFASGHVLALRRFTASSLGPGYTSVWHRDPSGRWTFYADVEPGQACARYFGSAVEQAVACPIELSWPGPRTLHVCIESAALDWTVEVAPTLATRAMNVMSRRMPERLWKERRVLALMAALAGPTLRAGRLGVYGRAPNGQQFIANPIVLWAITGGRATIAGVDLGPQGPLAHQARLGDFWIPQRGLLAVGRAYFEPFDPALHSAAVSQQPATP